MLSTPTKPEQAMNMKEISAIANAMSIPVQSHKKIVLIHTIQRTEGNFPCFATAYQGRCDQPNCKWRKDCLTTSVKKLQ